jgi:hypothetical protein
MLEPVDDNHSTSERLLNDPGFAEGVLDWGYTRIPVIYSYSYALNEAATDNAVINDKTHGYLRMATGQWASTYNPLDVWATCLSGIQSVNHFLSLVDDEPWKSSMPDVNELYIKRFKGESYGLRALLKYYLLQTIAGEDESGNMLGIPILNEFLEKDADFNIPRASFVESVNSIYDDINQSLSFFTMDDYRDVSNPADLPSGYEKYSVSDYTTVFGITSSQRISGRIVKALRTKTALLAASPAFAEDASLWVATANYAGNLLKSIGGVSGLDPEGHRFWIKSNVDKVNLLNGVDQPEMLWRSRKTTSRSRESDNFPPSLFGYGRINPTQNIVDVFPMLNGYPISHANSAYDPLHPYADRDPRLNLYVIYNGSTYKGTVIRTGAGGGENAKDSIDRSTRTGYYLKKLLVEEVSLNPSGLSDQNHYEVYMRYTEIFLIYAEAANEAWGPDGDNGGFGFTARDVVAAIRKRAGITQPDAYLASVTTKDDMRQLIRNERRIELAFEGFRFWDLRRWKASLTEPARGIEINTDATMFDYVEVEPRLYTDYMYYGPLPDQEIVKYGNLVQNKGW